MISTRRNKQHATTRDILEITLGDFDEEKKLKDIIKQNTEGKKQKNKSTKYRRRTIRQTKSRW